VPEDPLVQMWVEELTRQSQTCGVQFFPEEMRQFKSQCDYATTGVSLENAIIELARFRAFCGLIP
jgi:hypothetical protein